MQPDSGTLPPDTARLFRTKEAIADLAAMLVEEMLRTTLIQTGTAPTGTAFLAGLTAFPANHSLSTMRS